MKQHASNRRAGFLVKPKEVLDCGKFFPITKTLIVRCCRCGMKHTHRYRVRKGGKLELCVE